MKPSLLPLSLWLVTLIVLPSSAWAARKNPELDALDQQLSSIQAKQSNEVESAYYLQTQAQRAIQAVVDASSHEKDAKLSIAKERVETVVLTAQSAGLKQSLEPLLNSIHQLQLDAKQREVEQAQQALDQLKTQLQTQIQYTDQARQTAEAENAARQDAEQALQQVAGKQQAHLSAARKKTTQLNHEEAEITAGTKLPRARMTSRGEVFTFNASAFDSNNGLASLGSAQVKALSAYLKLSPKAHLEITGYDAQADQGQQLANAVQQALLHEGISPKHIKTTGHADHHRTREVECIIKL